MHKIVVKNAKPITMAMKNNALKNAWYENTKSEKINSKYRKHIKKLWFVVEIAYQNKIHNVCGHVFWNQKQIVLIVRREVMHATISIKSVLCWKMIKNMTTPWKTFLIEKKLKVEVLRKLTNLMKVFEFIKLNLEK
jgi:hypothetical protein